MSEDDEIEREDPYVWAIAERLFEADRKPYDAPTLEAARPCDIQAMCEWAEGFVATARHIGLTASDLAGLAEGTHVVVPVEPTEAMWRGLARDLMMWQELGRPSGKALYAHLKALGKEAPDWLRREIKDIDWVPSKGDRAVVIYRAMIEARPGAKEEDR